MVNSNYILAGPKFIMFADFLSILNEYMRQTVYILYKYTENDINYLICNSQIMRKCVLKGWN